MVATIVVLLLIATAILLVVCCATKYCGSSAADEGEVAPGNLRKVGAQDEEEGSAQAHDQSTEVLTIKPKLNKVAHKKDVKLSSIPTARPGTNSTAEQQSMTDFKQRLAKVAKLTPEAFFRVCDYSYRRELSTGDFRKKLSELELGLSEKCVHHLVSIMDESFSGAITLEEYYFALEAYGCRGEELSPLEGEPNYVSFQWRSVSKLLDAMKRRGVSEDELFRAVDTDGDQRISLHEMEEAIRIFSDFKVKELRLIHNFFDIDNNGLIDEKEFRMQMRKVAKKYEKSGDKKK